MSRDLAARTLAGIPGWQEASVEPLPGGSTGRAWLASAGERRAVLKVDAAPRPAPYNERPAEARIQARAASAGLAPRVLHAGETSILTEYEDGRHFTREDFDDEDRLVALAGALKRLHSLPLSGRVFDAPTAARRYLLRLDGADPVMAARCLAVVDAMRSPANLCLCHNDLVAGNILAAPGIRFVDWEYACDNDPFFDLATVVAHHELSNAQVDCLLEAYFGGDGARWHEQLVRHERLYDALHWLWLAARQSGAPELGEPGRRLGT